MLIKTLNFDNDVLNILRSMEWSEDGLFGRLVCGQIDRELYIKVNRAIETMGGKWNRKVGGHVFIVDPRGQVEGLLENGSLEVERDGFFETPQPVVERMLALVPIPQFGWAKILEPSAGLGAIVDVISNDHHFSEKDILCIEKNKQRAEKLSAKGYMVSCCDFLEWEQAQRFECIYMNPPFEELQDIDHVKHAFDVLKIGGAMISVMGEGAFFRSDKKSVAFREWLKEVYAEVIKLPAGSFKESGTMVNARLVKIRK